MQYVWNWTELNQKYYIKRTGNELRNFLPSSKKESFFPISRMIKSLDWYFKWISELIRSHKAAQKTQKWAISLVEIHRDPRGSSCRFSLGSSGMLSSIFAGIPCDETSINSMRTNLTMYDGGSLQTRQRSTWRWSTGTPRCRTGSCPGSPRRWTSTCSPWTPASTSWPETCPCFWRI